MGSIYAFTKSLILNPPLSLPGSVEIAYQQVKQFAVPILGGSVLIVQSVIATARSCVLRWNLMIGAFGSYVVILFRREPRIILWSAAIGFCVILLESFLATLVR